MSCKWDDWPSGLLEDNVTEELTETEVELRALTSALAWAMRYVPQAPEADLDGWVPRELNAWTEDLVACRGILRVAEAKRSAISPYLFEPETRAERAEAALERLCRCDETELPDHRSTCGLRRVGIKCGPVTPLHDRRWDEHGKYVGCGWECNACAAGLRP